MPIDVTGTCKTENMEESKYEFENGIISSGGVEREGIFLFIGC